jgi:hypothetical protein
MGIFDIFKGKQAAPAAPADPRLGPPPSTPQRGVVERFDAADGVGVIRLQDGATVRFGRSACRGDFMPMQGVPLEVVEIKPHPLGGWRATAVASTGETSAVSDGLLDDRREALSAGEAIATALQLGFVSVLLDVAIDGSRQSLRTVLEPVVDAVGGKLHLSDVPPKVTIGNTDLTLIIGTAPFPDDEIDGRFWPNGTSFGRSFIAIEHGLPDLQIALRKMREHAASDEWSIDGRTRQRMRFIFELLSARGVGVIAHGAGNVAFTKNEWLRRVGDVDDATVRGFTGLIDVGMDEMTLFTQGMNHLGLPDVQVDTARLGLDDDEAYHRAQSAALFACHRMNFENRALPETEPLRVPIGIEIGSSPIERDNPGFSFDLADEYVVQEEDDGATLVLTPALAPTAIAQLWSNATSQSQDFPYPAYRSLLKAKLEEQSWRQIERMTLERSDLSEGELEHEVLVMARPNGTFSTMTSGFGRRKQPGGDDESDDAHIEFIVTMSTHGPRLASFLSYVGRVLHGRGADDPPWGPQHRIALDGPLADAGFPYVVFAWAGKIEIENAPSICLYAPIPMTAKERETVPIHAVSEWIQSTGMGVAEMRWRSFVGT